MRSFKLAIFFESIAAHFYYLNNNVKKFKMWFADMRFDLTYVTSTVERLGGGLFF